MLPGLYISVNMCRTTNSDMYMYIYILIMIFQVNHAHGFACLPILWSPGPAEVTLPSSQNMKYEQRMLLRRGVLPVPHPDPGHPRELLDQDGEWTVATKEFPAIWPAPEAPNEGI